MVAALGLPIILTVTHNDTNDSRTMKTGLLYAYPKRHPVYGKLRRQIVTQFTAELRQATGWKKNWIRWKRAFTLEMRYNELLFSGKRNYVVR